MSFEKVVPDEISNKECEHLSIVAGNIIREAVSDLERRFTVKEAHYIMFEFKRKFAASLLAMNLNYIKTPEMALEFLHGVFNDATYANHIIKQAGKGVIN